MKRWLIAGVFAFFSVTAQATAVPPPFDGFRSCVAFQSESVELSPDGATALITLFGIRKHSQALESVSFVMSINSDANATRDWKRLLFLKEEIQKLRPGAEISSMMLRQLFDWKEWAPECQAEEVEITFSITSATYPELCSDKKIMCVG